jgi:hypothetical protein
VDSKILAEKIKKRNPRRRDKESNRVVFCLYFRVFFFMGHFYFGISLNEEKISTTFYSGLRLGREMGECSYKLTPCWATIFPQKNQHFAIGQNAGQLAKMYSTKFVDNVVVAELFSFKS